MTTEPHSVEPQSAWGDIAFGLFLLMLSAGIFVMLGEIDPADYGDQDPGPQALPRILAVVLLIGGLLLKKANKIENQAQ